MQSGLDRITLRADMAFVFGGKEGLISIQMHHFSGENSGHNTLSLCVTFIM